MLSEAVAAGRLPPVERRLPTNPMLVQPVERIGDYGGVWRTALFQDRDAQWLDRAIGCDNLIRWDPEWTRVIPNLAEHFAVNSNATEYSFRLRAGLRWSDGAPFTVDDILFWHEFVYLANPEAMEHAMPWFFVEHKSCAIIKRDAQTVTFKFPSPQGLFLPFLAGYYGDEPTRYPRHYLARFVTPPLQWAESNSMERAWQNFFHGPKGTKGDLGLIRWRDPQLPTLDAWQLTKPDDAGGYLEAERNPYYWKVDLAGNQLPYLDRVVFYCVKELPDLLDMACRGQFDLAERTLTVCNHLPLLETNRVQGDYRFLRTIRDRCNTAAISLNLNHPDPARRQLFQNKDFRIGLSHAIDRQRIINEVYAGQGEPAQPAPRPESPFYSERLARQYAEFNPALANLHLDRAGLTRRDASGRRLMPDGQPLTLVMEVVMSEHVEAMKLVAEYWQAVGIEAEVQAEDNGMFFSHINANEHDVAVWWGEGGLDALSDPRNFFPYSGEALHAPLWARWFADADDPSAEYPPPDIRRQMQLFSEIRATPDLRRQTELMKQILRITADGFPVMGISFEPISFILVRNNFRNVPAIMPNAGFTYLCPSPANPCQFYVRHTPLPAP